MSPWQDRANTPGPHPLPSSCLLHPLHSKAARAGWCDPTRSFPCRNIPSHLVMCLCAFCLLVPLQSGGQQQPEPGLPPRVAHLPANHVSAEPQHLFFASDTPKCTLSFQLCLRHLRGSLSFSLSRGHCFSLPLPPLLSGCSDMSHNNISLFFNETSPFSPNLTSLYELTQLVTGTS